MNSFLRTLQTSDAPIQVNSLSDLTTVIDSAFFPMALSQADQRSVAATFKTVQLGALSMVGCHTSCPIVGVRTMEEIHQDLNKDHCLVYMPLKQGGDGRSWHYQAGKQATGGPRLITMIEGDREYRVHRPRFLGLTLVVPKAQLQTRLPRLDQYCVKPHDANHGALAVTWDFIMSVWHNHARLGSAEKQHYAELIVEQLINALRAGESATVEGHATRQAYLQRAMEFIDAHICSTDITPELIADRLGIKKRYLHEVFASHEQTLGTVIREKRLEKCRESLSQPEMNGLSVTEIAYRWGFTSYTHFSRVFKEKYGTSPRKFRQQSS